MGSRGLRKLAGLGGWRTGAGVARPVQDGHQSVFRDSTLKCLESLHLARDPEKGCSLCPPTDLPLAQVTG